MGGTATTHECAEYEGALELAVAKDGIVARLVGIKLDFDLEGSLGRGFVMDNGEGSGGEGAMEEDLSAERELDGGGGIYDIIALDVLGERVESLAGYKRCISDSVSGSGSKDIVRSFVRSLREGKAMDGRT